jgi:hypothetical protein
LSNRSAYQGKREIIQDERLSVAEPKTATGRETGNDARNSFAHTLINKREPHSELQKETKNLTCTTHFLSELFTKTNTVW